MKNKLKSVRSSSKSAAASQPKTAQSRANIRPPSPLPCIALFPKGDGDSEGGGISEEVMNLSNEEYALLKRAFGDGSGILMHMANLALAKAREAATEHSEPRAETAHDQLEVIVSQAVAAISVLSDVYWDGIDQKCKYQTTCANGLIGLAAHASDQLRETLSLAVKEWREARGAEQPSSERRAA